MGVPRGLICIVAIGATLAGCASRAPSGKAFGDNEGNAALAKLSIPLDLRDFEVVNLEGHRGVFLKFSRLPDAVEHSSQSDPPRIILDIRGPTGAEAPEETFPGQDSAVSRLHVERRFGVLRIVLDLQGNDVPRYSVHQMADWVMVRLDTPQSGAIAPPMIGADTAKRAG